MKSFKALHLNCAGAMKSIYGLLFCYFAGNCAHADNISIVQQSGSGNVAVIKQGHSVPTPDNGFGYSNNGGDSGNVAITLQQGDSNTAKQFQAGIYNNGVVAQQGIANSVLQLQAGKNNAAVTAQNGRHNQLKHSQIGANHKKIVSQVGNGYSVVITR